jgi:hypothetical protein
MKEQMSYRTGGMPKPVKTKRPTSKTSYNAYKLKRALKAALPAWAKTKGATK